MNEYIDRDALRQAVLESQHDNPHPRGMAHIAHDCEHAHFVAMIARFPAADVAPVVHGRWIFKFDGPYRRRRGYCSICGQHSGIGGIQKNQEKPFCPNCGAKMDGGDNDAAD